MQGYPGKVLRRSRQDSMMAGVCGGIAEYYGLSSTKVRLVYVLLSIFLVAFPGIFLYLVLWLLIPREESPF